MEGHSNVTPMGASQQLPLFSDIFLRITFLTVVKSFLPCIAWRNTTSGVLKKLHRSLNEQSDLRLQPKWQPAPLKEDTSLVTQLCPPFRKVMKKYQLDTKSTSIQSSPSIIETAPSTLADQDEESEGLVSASEDNIKDTTIRETGERGPISQRQTGQPEENRSRPNIVRILNLPEKLKIVTQLDCWSESYQKSSAQKTFLLPSFAGRHTAWENPTTTTDAGDAPRPRPTIVKLLNIKNQEKMMHLARQNWKDSLSLQPKSVTP